MTIHPRMFVRLAFVSAAAAALVACKTTPPPTPVVIDTPPPPVVQTPPPVTPPQVTPPPVAPPPVAPPPVGVGPGSQQDFVVNVGDRVYFDTDSYSIRGDAQAILAAQASWLARYPAVTIRIEGNADERGTREYNFALGERRASAVRDYLVSRGVAASRIEVVSYGKERPIDPGTSEEAWQRNRNGHTAITGGAR